MLGLYVTEKDEQLRARGNRMFVRLAAALPEEVALRYGYTPHPIDLLAEKIAAAARAVDLDEATGQIARAKRRKRDEQSAG